MSWQLKRNPDTCGGAVWVFNLEFSIKITNQVIAVTKCYPQSPQDGCILPGVFFQRIYPLSFICISIIEPNSVLVP